MSNRMNSDLGDDIGVDLTGPIIDVFVGPKHKQYSIHEYRLSKCCAFFDRQVKKAGLESPEKTIHLADDDEEAFEMFATWLYKRTIKPVNATIKYKEDGTGFVKDHYATVNPYFELYFMAEERNLVPLKNHTMDALQAYVAEYGFAFGAARTDQVYKRTRFGSAMRRYLVENYLQSYMNKGLDDEIAQEAMSRRMKMRNGFAFALDMFEMVRKKNGRWRDPNRETGCDFHDHEDGDECVR